MNNAEPSITASGLAWFKSSFSGAQGGDCLEVAAGHGAVYVRDSKNLAGPMLTMSSEAWAAFVDSASS